MWLLAFFLFAQDGDAQIGNWHYQIKTDPMTDRTVFTALTVADSKVATLFVRCAGRDVEFAIDWNQYVSTQRISVKTRIGSGDPQESDWNISTDRQVTFYDGDTKSMVEAVAQETRLVAQVIPYSKGVVTEVFQVDGLAGIIERARDSCSW